MTTTMGDNQSTPETPGAPLVCRGIRGATSVSENTAEEILEATNDLLVALIKLNAIEPENVVSAIFTTTTDLTAGFPAVAARNLGWTEVPLLCTHEMAVPGALGKVVRILLHVNTTRRHAKIRHVYLKDARALRPDWGLTEREMREVIAGSPALAGNSV